MSDRAHEWRKAQRGMETMTRLRATHIPKRFLHRSLADYKPLPHTEQALATVQAWVDDFGMTDVPAELSLPFEEIPRNAEGVGLIGPSGLTKTTLMCLAGVEISRRGFAVRFTTLAGWVHTQQQMMRISEMRRAASMPEADVASMLEDFGDAYEWDWEIRNGAHLVIWDDVGREHHGGTGWAASLFDEVLRHRYDAGLCNAVTSNLALDRWAVEYSAGMRSFVQECCGAGIVTMRGQDMRLAG